MIMADRRKSLPWIKGARSSITRALYFFVVAPLFLTPVLHAAQPVPINELYEKGEKAMQAGNLRVAEKYFLRVIRSEHGNPAAFTGLSSIYLIQRRYDEGLKILEDAIERDPNDAALQLRKGHILRDAQRPDKAREAFLKAVELEPDSVHVAGKAASFFRHAGNMSKANEFEQRRKQLNKESGR